MNTGQDAQNKMDFAVPPNPGVLLAGCDIVGEVHANALAELANRDGGHLAGMMDVDRARAKAFGRQEEDHGV
jgi:hypothetical protein